MAKGKKAKATKVKAPETTKAPELGKNQMLTKTGKLITTRGPEKKRVYGGGNVEWQAHIRQLRCDMRLALHTTQIGAPDSLCAKFKAAMDKTYAYILGENHTVPSDITTDMAKIADGEISPASHDFTLALNHLNRLVKFVEDEKDKALLQKEIVAAKESRKLALS